MIISNRQYDRLKWIALVCIPALVVFIQSVEESLPVEWTPILTLWLNALGVLIGSLLQVSSRQYHKYEKGEENGKNVS